jgi:hypothetical protein
VNDFVDHEGKPLANPGAAQAGHLKSSGNLADQVEV